MKKEEEGVKRVPFWDAGLNPITGWPKQRVLGGERLGLDTLKLVKRENNKYSN